MDCGLEKVVAQKLVGLMRNAVASACNPCYCPLSLNRYKFILLTFLSEDYEYLHTKSLKQLKKKPDPGSGGEGLEGRIKQEIRDS